MSTRVKKDFDFLAGVYFQQKFLLNVYSISLYFDITTESMADQQIAVERVKHLIEGCLTDCVFVNQKEKKIIEKLHDLNFRVSTLPDDPYDQIVTIALLSKVNAVVENRFECTNISLLSRLSDGVEFLFDIEENFGPFEEKGRWWNDSTMIISDIPISDKKDKIVKLKKQNNVDWQSVGLDWSKTKSKDLPDSGVVFFMDTDK